MLEIMWSACGSRFLSRTIKFLFERGNDRPMCMNRVSVTLLRPSCRWLMLQQDLPDDFVVATGETHSVKEFCQA